MNFSMISYVVSWVMKLEACSMILPLFVALLYHENTALSIFIVLAFSLMVGFVMGLHRPKNTEIYAREGFVIVAFSWIAMSLVGALPFWLSGRMPNFVDAFFEIVSGFTTTGSSVLGDVEALGKGLLFWRSFSHWIGGMGVLVLVLTILPLGGGYNMMIMKAESPGPDVSKIVPRVADTAKMLYEIYFVLTVIMIVCYLLSGMPLFDALCIGFGTAGTGGFAIRNSGMADYNSFSQNLITIFMILFGVNFNFFYLLLMRRFRDALKCEEVRIYILIILCSIGFITWNILPMCKGNAGFALHHSAFTVASIITTTGFSTLDFNLWPEPSRFVLLGLMFCGACAGSTGGGLKVSRLIIMIREVGKELHMIIHPESVKRIRLEGKCVEHSVVRSVNCYLVMYVLIFVVSQFIISFDGYNFTSNFSAVAATFNNIGPGLDAVGPVENFAKYSNLSKLVLSFDMLAGRLEILPMLILFSRKTWRKTN